MKKCLAMAALCTSCMAGIWAQGTAFTYQGRLMENGTPFNGTIELEATLWDAATNGTPINPLRPVMRMVDVSNGLFSVSLDFSKGAFTGAQRWLQIESADQLGPNAVHDAVAAAKDHGDAACDRGGTSHWTDYGGRAVRLLYKPGVV